MTSLTEHITIANESFPYSNRFRPFANFLLLSLTSSHSARFTRIVHRECRRPTPIDLFHDGEEPYRGSSSVNLTFMALIELLIQEFVIPEKITCLS